MPAPITIPTLPSWTKQGPAYSLYVDAIGYLDIVPTPSGYKLYVRPYEHGIAHGPVSVLAERTTAAQLVEVAQQLYTAAQDQPVKKSTF